MNSLSSGCSRKIGEEDQPPPPPPSHAVVPPQRPPPLLAPITRYPRDSPFQDTAAAAASDRRRRSGSLCRLDPSPAPPTPPPSLLALPTVNALPLPPLAVFSPPSIQPSPRPPYSPPPNFRSSPQSLPHATLVPPTPRPDPPPYPLRGTISPPAISPPSVATSLLLRIQFPDSASTFTLAILPETSPSRSPLPPHPSPRARTIPLSIPNFPNRANSAFALPLHAHAPIISRNR